jgi:hypothetical protein
MRRVLRHLASASGASEGGREGIAETRRIDRIGATVGGIAGLISSELDRLEGARGGMSWNISVRAVRRTTPPPHAPHHSFG